jgi:putative flippase GtrA
VVVTWLFNRTFVFGRAAAAASEAPGEFARYLAVQGSGAALNFAVFSALVFAFSGLRGILIVPLGIASGVAMLFNFALLSVWVYRPSDSDNARVAAAQRKHSHRGNA